MIGRVWCTTLGSAALIVCWRLYPQRFRQCMMTSSNGNIFRVPGPLCGEFTGPGEFPAQRPVTRSFDVFFDLRLNKRLSKQSWGWWFETPSLSLGRHRNVDPLLHGFTSTKKSQGFCWSNFVTGHSDFMCIKGIWNTHQYIYICT